MTGDDSGHVGLDEMLAVGMTYRQLDYWSRQGYLLPDNTRPGSGYQRRWPAQEREIARLIFRLIARGVELAVAARGAREAVESGSDRIDLGDGVVISLEAAA